MSTMSIVLYVLAGVLLVAYLARRNARVKKED